MRDYDVRCALKSQLIEEHRHEPEPALVVEELGLCNVARVDIAVVNGSMSGYEIKSARDRLDRLPNQVKVYSRVMDFSVLVVADNHIRTARNLLKPWWGIRRARVVGGELLLEDVRAPKRNPGVDPYSLAQLLWKQEAIGLLAARGIDGGVRSKPREAAWQRLADRVPLEELQADVRGALKARRGWRVDPAHGRDGESSPREGTLSGFLARRLR